MIVDSIGVKGYVILSLYDGKGGRLKQQMEVENLVTTAGKNFIVRKMLGATENAAKILIGQGTTYQYNITAPTTVITGVALNGKTLTYTPGKVRVTKNGVTVDPAQYTATSGSSIVLASPAINTDIIRVFSAIVSASDTALEGQLAEEPIQFTFIDQVQTNQIHYITAFDEDTGTGIISEIGLASDSNPSKLLCRTALTTPFSKAATDFLVVNWKLQIG